MLEVKNVTKKYGKIKANNDISLQIENGEIAILIGANGAGKSTLMKSIVGLLRYKGEIKIDGFDNKSLDAKAIIGYVPEMPAVYDMLTVSEHLEFIMRAYKMLDDGLCEKLLKRFDLYNKRNKLGKELSKGMQQKLSICCALAHKPKFIIFDEPMVGLDPRAIKELQLVFKELSEQGATVIISTHMLSSIENVWDSAFIMRDGEVKSTLRASELGQDGTTTLEQRFFEITESGVEK